MKQREAARLAKFAEAVAKAAAMVEKGSYARAVKSLESLAAKMAEKAKGAKTGKKRAPSGFALYVKKNSARAKKEYPNKTQPELMKIMGKWYREEKGDAPAKKAKKAPAKKAAKKTTKKSKK